MTTSNNNNQAASVSEVLGRFSAQDGSSPDKGQVSSKGASSTKSFYVPMGQMAFIIGELQKMLKFSVDQTEILAENQKQACISYMGGTTDANGVVTIDYTKGMIYCMQQAQIDAGKDAAEGLRQQSNGQWAAMGTSLGGLGLMGLNAGKSYLDSRGADFKTFKEQLTTARPADGIEGGAVMGPHTEQFDSDLTAQMNRWRAGQDCTYDASNPVQRTAMSRLKTQLAEDKEASDAIQKTLDVKIKEQSDTLSQIGTRDYSRNQMIKQGSDAGGSGFQAYYTAQQAKAREQEGKDSAAGAVLNQVQQQMSANLDKTREQADAARQEAIQVANLIAQVQNVRV